MRLITFQKLGMLRDSLDNGVGRRLNTSHGIKQMDTKHNYTTDGHSFSPFYCFATINGESISLRSIGRNWEYFKPWMGHSKCLMIELEVPEEDILNMKDVRVFSENKTVYYSAFEQHVRNVAERKGKTYEVLLSELKKEYIVSYRTAWHHSNGYDTLYTNVPEGTKDLIPMWKSDIIFSVDTYIRDSEIYESLRKEAETTLPGGYPEAIVKSISKFLPDKSYASIGLFDALTEGMSTTGTISWLSEYFKGCEQDAMKFIQDNNYPSIGEAEKLLKGGGLHGSK